MATVQAQPFPLISRNFSTDLPNDSDPITIDETTFVEACDSELNALHDSLLNVLDNVGEEYDIEFASGVITLSLNKIGTFVINRQVPNRQIWTSSPISGPRRYDYHPEDGSWLERRTSPRMTLQERLEEELSAALSQIITL